MMDSAMDGSDLTMTTVASSSDDGSEFNPDLTRVDHRSRSRQPPTPATLHHKPSSLPPLSPPKLETINNGPASERVRSTSADRSRRQSVFMRGVQSVRLDLDLDIHQQSGTTKLESRRTRSPSLEQPPQDPTSHRHKRAKTSPSPSTPNSAPTSALTPTSIDTPSLHGSPLLPPNEKANSTKSSLEFASPSGDLGEAPPAPASAPGVGNPAQADRSAGEGFAIAESDWTPEPVPRTRSRPTKAPQPKPSRARGARPWVEGAIYKQYTAPELVAESGSVYRIQGSTCQQSVYSAYPQCHMCVTRQVGDICLFRGVRSFRYKSVKSVTPIGPPLFLSSDLDDDSPQFPVHYDQPFTTLHAQRLKTFAAPALLPILVQELAHASLPTACRIKLGLAERSLCDTCLHAMFGGKYQCYLCGREQCLECHAKLGRIEADAARAGVSLGQHSINNKNDIDLQRLTKCSGRADHNPIHSTDSFLALTRFKQSELARWVRDMTAWHEAHPVPQTPVVEDEEEFAYYSAGQGVEGNMSYLRVPLGDIQPRRTLPSSAQAAVTCAGSESSLAVRNPSLEPPLPADLENASDLFHGLWSKGETMVVDVSPAGLGFEAWTPVRFAADVAGVECIVASNITGIEHFSTVGNFFSNFGKGDSSGQSLKIKDWPSSSNFEHGLPDCFSMYMNSLPFGSVTRRDGVLNVAAHYPTNANPPDLGPKGYFSEISNDEPGGNGSTKLHMDVADAVNLMLWAGPTSTGEAGFAAWDLFKAEDADKIREFLYELKAAAKQQTVEFIKQTTNDPIHGQNYFLDRALRARLAEEKGVRPWRIYQKPGEVVFIPAGCAHQVCNFADCIKIASDFVSLENVQRCEKLTDEFRHQTKDKKLWRTDILQLKSQLLWAWRSCERFDNVQDAATAQPGGIDAAASSEEGVQAVSTEE